MLGKDCDMLHEVRLRDSMPICFRRILRRDIGPGARRLGERSDDSDRLHQQWLLRLCDQGKAYCAKAPEDQLVL